MQIKRKIIIKEKAIEIISDKSLVATLKWKSSVDLDLYAFYEMKDFLRGMIYFKDRGSLLHFPFLELDKDSGVGDKGGDNEENIRIPYLDHYNHILICANIFNKPYSNFSKYDGSVSVVSGDDNFIVPLTAKEIGSWCVVAHIENIGHGNKPVIHNVNKTIIRKPTIDNFLDSHTDNKFGPKSLLKRFFRR